MAILTRAEFAATCNRTVMVVNTNISRNKISVIPPDGKMIDSENPLNKIFKKNCLALDKKRLEEEKIKEVVLYYEPFVAYIPESHKTFAKTEIVIDDLDINEILLLQDGHCFRDGILNLCKNKNQTDKNHFQLEISAAQSIPCRTSRSGISGHLHSCPMPIVRSIG